MSGGTCYGGDTRHYDNCSHKTDDLTSHKIQDEDLEMELDTGASVSLISEENFKKIQKNGVSLQESKAKLFTCTGDEKQVRGCSDVRVEYNGQTVQLPLIVTGGSGPSLFCRNWLTALGLDWQGIFAVNKVTMLEEVLEKYQEGFNDELDC